MRLHFLGGARTIGCSCTLIEEDHTKILIDLGGDPAGKTHLELSDNELGEINAIILTHAHFDHYGGIFDIFSDLTDFSKIPPIYCTDPTGEFLFKFGYKEWINFADKPRFLEREYLKQFLRGLRKRVISLTYGKSQKINDVEIIPLPASHILGSAQIYVRSTWTEGLFTSDFKPSGTFLLERFSPNSLQETYNLNLTPKFIVIESTYGKDKIDVDPTATEQSLVQSIQDIFSNGGNLFVPCFAIGRAQEFMTFYFDLMQRYTGITPLRIYFIGGTTKSTVIYHKYIPWLVNTNPSRLAWADQPFVHDFDAYFKDQGSYGDLRQKLAQIKQDGLNVFVSSGGMLQGPALEVFHELKDDPHSGLFLVGYQPPGTSGHALLETVKDVSLRNQLVQIRDKLTLLRPAEVPRSKRLPVPKPASQKEKRVNSANKSKIKAISVPYSLLVRPFSLFSAHATFQEKISFLNEIPHPHKQLITLFATHGTAENCVELANFFTGSQSFSGLAPKQDDILQV